MNVERARQALALSGLRALGAAMSIVAVDHGGLIGKRPLLVLAPHPDDETLGCGATVARARALGAQVRLVVVSDGAASPGADEPATLRERRARELALAAGRLGVPADHVTSLGFPDGQLPVHEPRIVRSVGAVLDGDGTAHRPIVFAPSPYDPHPDHAAVGRAAREICSACDLPLYAYPVWQWNGLSEWRATWAAGRDRGRLAKVSTRGHLAPKEAALAAYQSQLGHTLGGTRGAALGRNLVGAFFSGNELFLVTNPTAPALPGRTRLLAGTPKRAWRCARDRLTPPRAGR